MFPKIIKFKEEGHSEILNGINILANAVKSTLGPQGRNVLIGNKGRPLRFTKDGVSVAKEVHLYDEIQNAGVNVIREVAINTCHTVGDGTTTATVIAQSIINNGINFIKDGSNPIALKEGMSKALEKVMEFLGKNTIEISSPEDVINIATISANGDREIGKIIADTFKKVGKDGVITLEESPSFETESIIVEGLQIDNGYITPYFVTNTSKMICELDDPYILIYDRKISTLQPMLPLLESIARANESLLIIAEDVDHEALGMLVLNNKKNNFKVAAVKSPYFGSKRIDIMSDLSIMCASTVVSEDTGTKLENLKKDMLGRAKKIIITQDKTTFIGGYGEKDNIEARCQYLRNEIENTPSQEDKKNFEERLAKLTDGVAVIKIGAHTEFEMKERKDRVEDAVHATRSALKGGILPGGATSLIKAYDYLGKCEIPLTGFESEESEESEEFDEMDKPGGPIHYAASFAQGVYLIEQALKAPWQQIIENAGKIPEEIEDSIEKDGLQGIFNIGYDALNFKIVDMVKAGIIDPANVVITALKDAVSISSLLLTTDVIMIEENEITLNAIQDPSNPLKIRR